MFELGGTVIVATKPTELLQSKGEPKLAPIPGTHLLYVTNSSNDILLDLGAQTYYVLISGRWFTSKALTGPWTFVAGKSLPAEFAKIPADHPMADVLISVPGTPQAREAAIANQIPQTATVQRDVQPSPVQFDGGEPQWKPIDGTPLSYAPNTAAPVIQVDPKSYYMVQNGVWFSATTPAGPYAVATTVPAVIYSIPTSSPVHYVTYVRVYSSTPTTVFVGYTPGYYGTVTTIDGVVVYGTGYAYPVYVGTYWYPPPPTYGWGFGFTVGLFWGAAIGGGWGNPCCWGGGGGVYVSHHHHNNINIDNSYNRWGNKSQTVSGPRGNTAQTHAGRQHHGRQGRGLEQRLRRARRRGLPPQRKRQLAAVRRQGRRLVGRGKCPESPLREYSAVRRNAPVARPAASVARDRSRARAAGPAAHRGLPGRWRHARRRRTRVAGAAEEGPAGGSAAFFRCVRGRKSVFTDPQDGAFDASEWLLDKKGFLPVPILITEPAIGYGGGATLLWFRESIGERQARGRFSPPDIFGGALAATENGTTLVGALGMVTFADESWRWRGFIGRPDVNLDFYGGAGDDLKIGYNLEGWATTHLLQRRLGESENFIGARWNYIDFEARFDAHSRRPLAQGSRDIKSSGLGVFLEHDSRDNFFTPSAGWKFFVESVFYSPEARQRRRIRDVLRVRAQLLSASKAWIVGLRADARAARGDVPFYQLPFIELRGIPFFRYQNENVALAEAEVRWNITPRWALVGFAGTGKADESASAWGLGVRRLVARRLGIYMGVDLAKGPEET